MRGWYVEVLLLSRETIRINAINSTAKEKFISGEKTKIIDPYYFQWSYGDDDTIFYEKNILYSQDITTDSMYSDLLDIERTLKYLIIKKVITKNEVIALDHMINNIESGKFRTTILKYFRSACAKVAFFLGGYFTDDGFLEYIRVKYELDDSKMEKIMKYINSEYRLREVILG